MDGATNHENEIFVVGSAAERSVSAQASSGDARGGVVDAFTGDVFRLEGNEKSTRAEAMQQAGSGSQEPEPVSGVIHGVDGAVGYASQGHVAEVEAEVPDGDDVDVGRDNLLADSNNPRPFDFIRRLSLISIGGLLFPNLDDSNVTEDTICQGDRVVPCVRATFGASGSLEAEVTWANPPWAMPALANAAQLCSKIALVSRGGTGSFFEKARLVQAAGAAAVVFVNDRAETPDENLCCSASGYAARFVRALALAAVLRAGAMLVRSPSLSLGCHFMVARSFRKARRRLET